MLNIGPSSSQALRACYSLPIGPFWWHRLPLFLELNANEPVSCSRPTLCESYQCLLPICDQCLLLSVLHMENRKNSTVNYEKFLWFLFFFEIYQKDLAGHSVEWVCCLVLLDPGVLYHCPLPRPCFQWWPPPPQMAHHLLLEEARVSFFSFLHFLLQIHFLNCASLSCFHPRHWETTIGI